MVLRIAGSAYFVRSDLHGPTRMWLGHEVQRDGIESALERAFEAAGGQDVLIGGGVSTIQQYMSAGLIDELHNAIAPILLGGGERLFDNLDGAAHVRLARTGN